MKDNKIMKRTFSSICILLLAVFLILLVSCAPAEKPGETAPVRTPEPNITAPTPEPGSFTLSAYTPTPEPVKEPMPGPVALTISEVSTNGCFTARKLNRIEGEWIELYNGSGAAVDLSGYSLSDREDNVLELVLPKQTVLPGAYVLIDLKDAPFHLKPGETVYLFDNATYHYDSLELPEQAEHTCGRNEAGETVLFRYPTPGHANRGGYPLNGSMPAWDTSDLYFSEVCASGPDEWVELYNGSEAPVSLQGWHISRNKEGSEAIALSGTVEPGAYLVIDGLTLPASGCTLYLTDENGFFRDIYETGVLPKGVSSGRDVSSMRRLFYTTPTKGAPNPDTGYTGFAPDIAFSENGLYQSEPFMLTLTAPDAEIYYTLNGTPPEQNGILYTGPIAVNGPTVVRAYAKKDGCLDSPEAIRHYLFTEAHTLPVICIAMDEDDFKKVYRVKERSQIVEKVCSLTYYYPDGSYGTSMRCAVKAKGRGSLTYAQKSLTFKLRNRFGQNFTDFPLFGPDVNKGIRYRSFCLRAGGQDYNRAIIRDTVTNRAAQNTAVDAVKTQPVAVYVNGEYLGLYMLQEEMNADYFVSHYGLNKDEIDIINQKAGVRHGTLDGYNSLKKYARSTKGTDAEYEKLCSMVDIDAYTDYIAIQLIVGNTDVLNQKVVQSRDGKLKFRPMLFDEDSAFGSRKTDLMYKYFKSPGFTPSSGDQILCDNDVFKSLYRFPTWRTKFWHRVVELLNTDFSSDNLYRIVDELAAEVESEIPRQIKRYGFHTSVTAWKDKVAELKSIIGARKAVVYDQLKHYFNITDADIRAYEREIGVG